MNNAGTGIKADGPRATIVLNDDTITFPRSVRGSYGFSSLAAFLSGAYNNAGFTQTFGVSVVAQSFAGHVEACAREVQHGDVGKSGVQ